MEQLLYENELINMNINGVLGGRRYWQTKNLVTY